MPIAALYAALLAPLFLILSARVIGRRREARVALGAGEDAELLRRMRVHANFAEYTPFALVCLALAESLATPALVLHLAEWCALARPLRPRLRRFAGSRAHPVARVRNGDELCRHFDCCCSLSLRCCRQPARFVRAVRLAYTRRASRTA